MHTYKLCSYEELKAKQEINKKCLHAILVALCGEGRKVLYLAANVSTAFM